LHLQKKHNWKNLSQFVIVRFRISKKQLTLNRQNQLIHDISITSLLFN
jgi:hypothetical protein